MIRKKKKMRRVEAYYGYYAGDLQVWDTMYVKIPDDTPEDQLEKLTAEATLDALEKDGWDNVAFAGLYNSNDEGELDQEDE